VPVVTLKHLSCGVAEHVGNQFERHTVIVELGRASVPKFVRRDAQEPGGLTATRQFPTGNQAMTLLLRYPRVMASVMAAAIDVRASSRTWA